MSLDQSLADVVGARHVLSDSDLKASYEHDFSGRYSGTARLVVRPSDTHQVAGVLAACASHGAAIVPQGGNTGLVGAGVPRDHEVLLSLQRLTEVGEVDPAIGQVTVGAGPRWRRSRRSRAARGSTQRSTSAPATPARSAASSRATPAAPGRCATGPRGLTSRAWRRCWPTARSSRGWRG